LTKRLNASATIVIPTYWTRPAGESSRPGDAIFDHPTPIDGESTLPRLLTSLARLEDRDGLTVIVLVGTTTTEVAEAAEARVAAMLAPYAGRFRTLMAERAMAARMQTLARDTGLPPDAVTLHTYAGVRNLQLLAPLALGSQIIIALDDDEVVAPDYLRIARQSAQRPGFWGAAGFYEDVQGNLFLPEGPKTDNIFLDKAAIMNAAMRQLIEAPGRWGETAIAFGGNMLFGRELASRIGFDPGITRGEDLDYVLNAHFTGLPFWLDKRLRITHLPPHQFDASPYAKLAEDIRRFFYEREKISLAAASIPPAIWRPYPGRFLQDDLEEHAVVALESVSTEQDRKLWDDPATIVREALERARTLAPRYARFASRWPVLTAMLDNNFLTIVS